VFPAKCSDWATVGGEDATSGCTRISLSDCYRPKDIPDKYRIIFKTKSSSDSYNSIIEKCSEEVNSGRTKLRIVKENSFYHITI